MRPETASMQRTSREPPGLDAAPDGGLVLNQRFHVAFDYPVHFTHNVFAPSNRLLVDAVSRTDTSRRQRLFVVIDDGVAARWPSLSAAVEAYADTYRDRLELVAPAEIVVGGERCKNDPLLVTELQARLVAARLDRHAAVVTIGGGAVLDLVGYVAATVHRGIRLVRLPTTVLAQNDAGIGVKNGVNGFGQKNLFGTFAPPFAVINDCAFLTTLDPRDKAAGMAEAVKVALIRDAAFFRWLEQEREALRAFDPPAVAYLVRRCAELHLAHIANAGDPFELGGARPLDFGHWAAHKLETLTDHALRHGEAVAIGVALDARYSVLAGLLAEGHDGRIRDLLAALGLPTWHEALECVSGTGERAVLRGLDEFREHLGGELTVTLLSEIGRGTEVHAIDHLRVVQAIEWLKAASGR